MFTTINRNKFGDCSKCGLQNTDVVKIKKDLFCLSCNRDMKGKQQIARANQRSKVRGLLQYQKVEGIVDTLTELKIDLDRVFSRFIRVIDTEKDGKLVCYICGKRVKTEKAHAMHFIPRIHMQTRFLTQNVKSGCYDCNVVKDGNIKQFANKLEQENKGIVEWLEEQKYIVAEPTRNELKQLLFDYQQKLHIVEQKLK